MTWHRRRLICSPQFRLSRNSALPHRVSASYSGCEPLYSAVQPVQVMTTRRRFSQVTETLACRHPKALFSACCSSLATLVQDYHLLSRHPCQRSLFTQWRDIPFTAPPRLYGQSFRIISGSCGCALSRQHDFLNPSVFGSWSPEGVVFQTSRGSPAPNNICSCFRNDLAVSV